MAWREEVANPMKRQDSNSMLRPFMGQQVYQYLKFIKDVHFDFTKWRVNVPKIGWVKLCKNKEFDLSEWKLGTLTITRDNCGDYWCTIVCHNDKPYPPKAKLDKDKSVGIDLGIKDYAIHSDGTKYGNPKFLEKEQAKLKHLQRRFARRQKGSKRRERLRLKIAKLHCHIANRRSDFIHKLTAKLIKSKYTTFILEDLNVEGMMKNHHLANAIQSAAWNEFKRQLLYKCDEIGKNVIFIGRFEPNSKMYHHCDSVNQGLMLSDREWTCPQCGRHLDRDVNAAINIRDIAFTRQVV